jgi:hypothetical protein
VKTMIIAAALVVSTAILAAESDQYIGTCFAYMMQNQHGDGARAVARMTTDLEAAQHYVIAGLRKKVDVADAAAACMKLGISLRNYKPSPVLTATQKD